MELFSIRIQRTFQLVSTGMSEADYIMRHIASCTDDNGNILTGANGGLAKFSVTDIY